MGSVLHSHTRLRTPPRRLIVVHARRRIADLNYFTISASAATCHVEPDHRSSLGQQGPSGRSECCSSIAPLLKAASPCQWAAGDPSASSRRPRWLWQSRVLHLHHGGL